MEINCENGNTFWKILVNKNSSPPGLMAFHLSTITLTSTPTIILTSTPTRQTVTKPRDGEPGDPQLG